jgi:hypothetical protein
VRAIAAIIVVGLMPACSFLSVRGPQADRRAGEAPSCSVSQGSVVTDLLLGVVLLAGGLAGEEAAPALIGAAYGGSSIYGMATNRRCLAARDAYKEEVRVAEEEEEEAARRRARLAAQPKPAPTRPAVTPVTAPGTKVLTDPFDPTAAPPVSGTAPGTPAAPADDGEPAPAASEAPEAPWADFWRKLP